MLKFLALLSAMFLQVSYANPAKVPDAKAVEPTKTAYTLAGDVVWHAVGSPGFLKIDGKGGTVDGQAWVGGDGIATGHFTVDPAGFKTGLELRDKHMKEKYLEVAKWKDAFFDLDAWKVTTTSSQFGGKLTIKGVTKQVFGTAVFDGKTLKADFEIDLSDFNVGVPSHLGVTVAKTVTVEITASTK